MMGLSLYENNNRKRTRADNRVLLYTHISKPHKILVAASAIKINGSRFYCVILFNFILSPFFFLPLFQFLSFYLPKLFGVPVFMSFISLIRLVGQSF